jgi:hypothetical protein
MTIPPISANKLSTDLFSCANARKKLGYPQTSDIFSFATHFVVDSIRMRVDKRVSTTQWSETP